MTTGKNWIGTLSMKMRKRTKKTLRPTRTRKKRKTQKRKHLLRKTTLRSPRQMKGRKIKMKQTKQKKQTSPRLKLPILTPEMKKTILNPKKMPMKLPMLNQMTRNL